MTFKNRIKDIDKLQEQINKYRPLNSHAVKQLREYYRIGLTYSSNALEGNSLTEIETKVILEDGITIGGKSVREHQEVIGHGEAYDLLYKLSKTRKITEKDIKELHRVYYYRIDELNAGTYRKEAVFISGTTFIPPKPSEVPGQMKILESNLSEIREKKHPVEYAALLHGDFVTVHPFVDGNGRTARLLMNLSLIQDGYVITVIPPVLRGEYISALREYNKGKKKGFLNLVSSMVYESQKEYIRLLEALK